MGLGAGKPVFGALQTKQRQTSLGIRADQPGHPCRLISAFVIRFLESIMCKIATGKISIF